MKLLFIAILFLTVQEIFGQASSTPTSQIINAKQLLSDLEVLSADDMQGRLVGSPGGVKAREYVARRFRESKIQPFSEKPFAGEYLQPFEFSNPRTPNEKIHGANIVGFIRGKQTPGKYICITAHYDHLGIRNSQVYNGADDNASGTVALFAMAEYFAKHPPANSLIFVAVDAEEITGTGSKKFVAEPPVAKDSIIMDVNIDMICRDKNDTLFAVGTYLYPFLKPYLETVAAHAPVKLLLGHDDPNNKQVEDWTKQQDGYTFHVNKIPFVYFGDEDYEQHHKPTDDYQTITPAFFVHSVETIIAAVEQFDRNLKAIENEKVRASGA